MCAAPFVCVLPLLLFVNITPQKPYPIKYPNPLHIPKQTYPHKPYSHHITPLLILPFVSLFPLVEDITKEPIFTPSSKGTLNIVHTAVMASQHSSEYEMETQSDSYSEEQEWNTWKVCF